MKIVVLAGGTSTERTVSITSGTGICKALRQKGHQAILVDIFCGIENVDRENPFPSEYDVDAASEYMSAFNDRIEQMKKERRSFFGPNVLKLCEAADIVFLGLHGANGEDGKVQATFDLMGIKYTGTGYLSSALAMERRWHCPPERFDAFSFKTVSRPSCAARNSHSFTSFNFSIISSSEAFSFAILKFSLTVPPNK